MRGEEQQEVLKRREWNGSGLGPITFGHFDFFAGSELPQLMLGQIMQITFHKKLSVSLWETAVWAIKDHPSIDLLAHLCPSMEPALMCRDSTEFTVTARVFLKTTFLVYNLRFWIYGATG